MAVGGRCAAPHHETDSYMDPSPWTEQLTHVQVTAITAVCACWAILLSHHQVLEGGAGKGVIGVHLLPPEGGCHGGGPALAPVLPCLLRLLLLLHLPALHPPTDALHGRTPQQCIAPHLAGADNMGTLMAREPGACAM